MKNKAVALVLVPLILAVLALGSPVSASSYADELARWLGLGGDANWVNVYWVDDRDGVTVLHTREARVLVRRDSGSLVVRPGPGDPQDWPSVVRVPGRGLYIAIPARLLSPYARWAGAAGVQGFAGGDSWYLIPLFNVRW